MSPTVETPMPTKKKPAAKKTAAKKPTNKTKKPEIIDENLPDIIDPPPDTGKKAQSTGKMTMGQLDLMRRERLALSRLTTKQKNFCEVWVRTFNKLLTLKESGYWSPKSDRIGTSQEKLIEQNFQRVMDSPVVQEYIFLLKQSVASRLGVSMDQIIDEYKSMAFANIADYVSWTKDGFTEIKASSALTREQLAGVVEVSETTTKAGKVVKLKLYNKQSALDRLFEVLKELEDNEDKPEGPAKISQTQINVILQDPVKRRAVEHLAESMYDKRISLVGTDKDRVEFQAHMEKITARLLGGKSSGSTNNGIGHSGERGGHAGVPCLPAPTGGSGEGEDQGAHGHESGAEAHADADPEDLPEVEAQGDAAEPEDTEAGSRYDINGL